MTKVAIVGHESAKFSGEAEISANATISRILAAADKPHLISGGCHLGGIDIWAEEQATLNKMPKTIYKPEVLQWDPKGQVGYKKRNQKIAWECDEIHVIVVREFPVGFKGKRWRYCYHCKTDEHIKSGACWTAHQAIEAGKRAFWHYIDQDGKVVMDPGFLASL